MTAHVTFSAWPDWARIIIRAAARLLHALERRRQVRRTNAALHDLSDHLLKDIGLRRGEADRRFAP